MADPKMHDPFLDKWHKKVSTRLDKSKGHMTDSIKLVDDFLNSKDASLLSLAKGMMKVGLSCYDTAIDWLYIGSKE